MRKSFNLIKNWDFKTRIDECDRIYVTPIPMSYSGEMRISELESLIKNVEDRVRPIFSGGNNVIYCFDKRVAEILFKKKHRLMLEDSQEIEIH